MIENIKIQIDPSSNFLRSILNGVQGNHTKINEPRVKIPNASPAHQENATSKNFPHSNIPFRHKPKVPIIALRIGDRKTATNKNKTTSLNLKSDLSKSNLEIKMYLENKGSIVLAITVASTKPMGVSLE